MYGIWSLVVFYILQLQTKDFHKISNEMLMEGFFFHDVWYIPLVEPGIQEIWMRYDDENGFCATPTSGELQRNTNYLVVLDSFEDI